MKKVKKPWGYEEIHYRKDGVSFKILCIKEGEETSLQFHNSKVETMIALDDNAVIDVANGYDGSMAYITNSYNLPVVYPVISISMNKGEQRQLNPGTIHRLKAINGDTKVAEISYGTDEDIIRLEDKYKRSKK